MSYTLLGLSQFTTTATFLGSILIPSRDITRPRYVTLNAQNLHFLISHYKPTSRRRLRTIRTCFRCLESEDKQIKILLIYVVTNTLRNSRSILLMYCQNVPGPFFTLNSITRYSKSPYYIQKAVYFSSPLRTRIWLKAATISSFIKYRAFNKQSSVS